MILGTPTIIWDGMTRGIMIIIHGAGAILIAVTEVTMAGITDLIGVDIVDHHIIHTMA